MTAVHISKMTGKLDGFRAISTNTVTNSFCQKMNTSGDTICRQCYSHGNVEIVPQEYASQVCNAIRTLLSESRAGSIGIADNPGRFLPYQCAW
jgi:hypothetical protein